MSRKTFAVLFGTESPTGTLSILAAGFRDQILTGGLSFAGSLAKKAEINLFNSMVMGMSAALTFAGNLNKKTSGSLNSNLTFSGAVRTLSLFTKALTAALTSSGTLIEKTLLSFAANLTNVGSLSRKTLYKLIAGWTAVGSLSRKTSYSLSASWTSAGALARRTGVSLAAALSATGSITKKTIGTLSGVLSLNGNLTNNIASVFIAPRPFIKSVATWPRRGFIYQTSVFQSMAQPNPNLFQSLSGGLSTSGAFVLKGLKEAHCQPVRVWEPCLCSIRCLQSGHDRFFGLKRSLSNLACPST